MLNATVLTCDDIRLEHNGKMIIVGMYTGNIIIPADGTLVPQLNFLFNVDCPIDEVPRHLVFEVTLPNGEPLRSDVNFNEKIAPNPEFTRWYMRHALTFGMPRLSPGKIKARVQLDDREAVVSTPWIELATGTELDSMDRSESSAED